jgi:hypothetical protein
MKKPVLPENPTPEQRTEYVTAMVSWTDHRVQASTAVLEIENSGPPAAKSMIDEAMLDISDAVTMNAALASEGVVSADNTNNLRRIRDEAKATLGEIDAKLSSAEQLATQRQETLDLAASLAADAEAKAPTSTTSTTEVAPDGSTSTVPTVTETFTPDAATSNLPTVNPDAPVDADALGRVAASAVGTLSPPEAKQVLGRPVMVGRAGGQFADGKIQPGAALDAAGVTEVFAGLAEFGVKGQHVGVIYHSETPMEARLNGDKNHNDDVMRSVVTLKGKLNEMLAPGETTNAGYARIQAGYNPDDRMQAAAIPTCLPGVFDYTQEMVSVGGTPVRTGFFDVLTIQIGDHGGFPLTRWTSPTLAEIEAAPGSALIDSEATKTAGIYDPKQCFIIPKNCPPPVVGTIGPLKTCICWDVDDEWAWKGRLRINVELTKVLADRRAESRRIEYAMANSQIVPLTYTYSVAQTLEVRLRRRMRQFTDQARRPRQLPSLRMLTNSRFAERIWEEIQLIPMHNVPTFAKDWTGPASVYAWMAAEFNISSITECMDNPITGTYPRALLPAPGVAATDVVAIDLVPWFVLAEAGTFVELEGPDSRLGSSVDDPYIGWSQATSNTRCFFEEHTEGFMLGRPYDTFRPQLFVMPGAASDGRWAAAATAAISGHNI